MSLDLQAIKARAEAATPGPWFVDRGGEINEPYYSIPGVCRDRYGDNSLMVGSDRPTADFIAHARTDMPALVAEIEMLRDAYDQLKSDADAEVGRLRIKAGEAPVPLCCLCDHPSHNGECSTDDEAWTAERLAEERA